MLKDHANFDAISLSKVIFITPFENEMSRSGKCVLKLFKDLCSIFFIHLLLFKRCSQCDFRFFDFRLF